MMQRMGDPNSFRLLTGGLSLLLAWAVLLGSAQAQVAADGLTQAAETEQPPGALKGAVAPSRGLGKRIAGWALSGLGVVSAGASAICFTDFYPEDAQELCLYGQLALGGVELGLGITFLILGYGEKAEYDAWKRDHAAVRHLSRFSIASTGQGAQLSYRLEF